MQFFRELIIVGPSKPRLNPMNIDSVKFGPKH